MKGDKAMINRPTGTRRRNRAWLLWLLLLPFIVTLWPGLYNQPQPELGGIPFFYWFQILCIFLTAILMAILYFYTE
jgi:Protein of unknown function (DUF3311)